MGQVQGQEQVQVQGRPTVLYFGIGSGSGVQTRAHAFYQLEYCISGKMRCLLGEERLLLDAGELVLVPPETPHLFQAGEGGFEFLSVKFDYPKRLAAFHGGDAPLRFHADELARIIGEKTPLSPFSPDGLEVLADILAAMLGHLERGTASEPQEARFLKCLRTLIFSRGYHTTVGWLAQKMGCTRYQLQYRFQQEQADGRLKQFIDQQVAFQATNHLRYSSMNISQIADAMHFPSLYVFSRFYKRCTGLSPRQARGGE